MQQLIENVEVQIKVDSNIDENTLRKGDMGTIKSQRSMDDIEKEIKESRSVVLIIIVDQNYHYDSAHEEEKKKYDFKRDPQLDTLLKRKQRMMEVLHQWDDYFSNPRNLNLRKKERGSLNLNEIQNWMQC